MNDFSVEDFISYCDEIEIVQEGFFKKLKEKKQMERKENYENQMKKINESIPFVKKIAEDFKRIVKNNKGTVGTEEIYTLEDTNGEYFGITFDYSIPDRDEYFELIKKIETKYKSEITKYNITWDGHIGEFFSIYTDSINMI